ncbi:MAG: LuxR family transcriptional regulator [Rhodocyclaceae bacterium]|nr:LuxR family transcriptional regulator [Rhodocyclaceae bacterium]
MIRILIAEDHAIVRSGVKKILASTEDMTVVGEATHGDEVLAQVRALDFDVLLLDLTMPGTSGTELIQQVLTEKPLLPVLILTMHNDGQIVNRVLRAGACGYVTKDSDPETLLTALRMVVRGGKFIDPALVDSVVSHASRSDALPHQRLSERELQVLKGLASGSRIGEVADALHLSPKTVSTHKMRLMQKLNVDNNADLIKYALQHQLAAE